MIRRAPNHVFPGRQPDMRAVIRQLIHAIDQNTIVMNQNILILRADIDVTAERIDLLERGK